MVELSTLGMLVVDVIIVVETCSVLVKATVVLTVVVVELCVDGANVVVAEFSSPFINRTISEITRNSSFMLPNQNECCISGNA